VGQPLLGPAPGRLAAIQGGLGAAAHEEVVGESAGLPGIRVSEVIVAHLHLAVRGHLDGRCEGLLPQSVWVGVRLTAMGVDQLKPPSTEREKAIASDWEEVRLASSQTA
jgi:hypothetical protein